MKKFLLFISFCLLCLSQINAVDDVFTPDMKNGAIKTSYTDVNHTFDSGNEYISQACVMTGTNYSGIQLRSKNNNSGIVTTKSIGNVKSISVEYHNTSNTPATLDVYGSNTPFTSPTNLYNTANQGTIIGSLTGSNTTLTVTGTYKYVGIRSNKGTAYIDKITISWEPVASTQVATPTAPDKLFYGEKYTISTSTEGATLHYTTNGTDWITEGAEATLYAPTEGESFTIKAYATKDGLTQSETLEKTVTLYAPTPAEAVFTNEAGEEVTGGDVKQGSYIKFSWERGCSAEVNINGTVTNYDAESTFGTWSVDDTYKAGNEVTISVTVTNKYNKTSTATATFTVVSPYKVVDVITVDDTGVTGTSYTSFSGKVKNGAEYAGRVSKYSNQNQNQNQIQLNYNTSNTKGAYGSAIFMTKSVGKVSKIILDIAYIYSNSTANAKCYVYGNHTPYNAYIADGTTTTTPPAQEDAYTYQTTNLGTLIGEFSEAKIETIENPGVTVDNPNGYQYILILVDGTTRFNSITFEWEDAFEYGKDITYEMQSETTKLTEGKFVTLVDATNKIAVSRNNAAEGTIAGAAASIVDADENSKTSLTLGKGQFSIDEFELVPAEGGFKLYGGGTITRRYIGVDATGLTTTADATAAAVVTLESDGKGVVVKFDDGEIIVSDGTSFGKGTASTESATSLAEGKALVPAYVFVSPGKDSTGVEDIEMVETEAPAQYYNLNGVEVKAGNLVPGIYIVRQGNKVSKQFIR